MSALAMVPVKARERWGPALVALALLAAAAALSAVSLGPDLARLLSAPAPAAGFDVPHMVLLYSSLPRLVTSLLCGAALGASGAILQQVMRNPLASPTTLGISAGANLALALVGLLAPGLFGLGRDLVALAGSTAAVLVVFGLVRRQGFAPMPLVLAGLVVGLYCGALSAILVLMNDRYLVSLFIWGSGSLSQQDWTIPQSLGLRLALLGICAALLVRPLGLLDIEDGGARSLGLSVGTLRALAVAVAVALAAVVTSAVGVIGFVGLVAPTLARLSGARRFGERLVWSTAIGAGLLWLTDATVQRTGGLDGDVLPTGAVTAIFGAPLLLLLLPRLRLAVQQRTTARRPAGFALAPRTILIGLAAGLVAAIALSSFVGREAGGGWAILPLGDFATVAPWRLPRMAAALGAGALLAAAGTILQRMTGNEMASPEILGLGAGATMGVALALFVFTGLGPSGQTLAAFAGAGLVLAALLAFGAKSGFAPERVLLAGIALNALIDAVVGVLSASGDPRALMLLSWMGGSTYAIDAAKAVETLLGAAVLLPAALLASRWLALLPLGETQARGLGVPLRRARLTLVLLAAGLTAIATPILGPFSFVGLMGPHIAAALGLRRPAETLAGAALSGGMVMVAADFVARTAVFPWQLPTGLTAALVGAPFLLWLLHRKGARG